MLKKNDLVKQFELLTKQEIINHNREILASNLLNNELRDQVRKLQIDYEREKGHFRDEMRNLYEEMRRLDHIEHDHSHSKRCLEVQICKAEEKNNDQIRPLESRFKDLYSKVEVYGKEIEHLQSRIIEMDRDAVSYEKQLKLELDKRFKNVYSEVDRLRQEVNDAPSKEFENIRLLEEDLRKTNFCIKSIYEEMENHKEKRFYNEKQIEYLLTQLDRLKKKVQQ